MSNYTYSGTIPPFLTQIDRDSFVYRGLVMNSNVYQQQEFSTGPIAPNSYQNINYTNFRIKEITHSRAAAKIENFKFQGYPPIYEGDDVTVYAQRKYDGMHATKIVMNDTGQVIYPSINFSLEPDKLKMIIIAAVVGFLIFFVASGGLSALISMIIQGLFSLFLAVLPLLIAGGAFLIILAQIFRR